jgi:hypothetical protein
LRGPDRLGYEQAWYLKNELLRMEVGRMRRIMLNIMSLDLRWRDRRRRPRAAKPRRQPHRRLGFGECHGSHRHGLYGHVGPLQQLLERRQPAPRLATSQLQSRSLSVPGDAVPGRFLYDEGGTHPDVLATADGSDDGFAAGPPVGQASVTVVACWVCSAVRLGPTEVVVPGDLTMGDDQL